MAYGLNHDELVRDRVGPHSLLVGSLVAGCQRRVCGRVSAPSAHESSSSILAAGGKKPRVCETDRFTTLITRSTLLHIQLSVERA